ncbi:recombinase family protein [Gallionella capsiferriformans]|uniref:Resolvase domain n=1 Tax=Gallionella capsiferriformans (strain ES-2) TaxID=395494 RepID=D9SGN1_GALCS|nr:recombinase family protein [Gallionella capsiferriformans]ADL55678.1 Resolvase domain [Gallionella capsiferriformans ES-2]
MHVALYARVSTTRQADNDLSIPDQLRQLREWAAANGHLVIQEYVEPGASATDDKRPVFQQMISDAMMKPAAFEVIVIHSLSRFFRDGIEFGVYERKLAKNKVKVVSITQPTSDDAGGEMMRRIICMFDEHQSKEISKHVSRSMKENARQGYFNGSKAPFGYQAVATSTTGSRGRQKKKLAIDPDEAEVVRLIYRLYLNGIEGRGAGVKEIAKYLATLGYQSRGKPWSIQKVHWTLSNTLYMGDYYFNVMDSKAKKPRPPEEWIKTEIPAIVDADIFERVRVLRESRAPQSGTAIPKVMSSPVLLAGIIKCGVCGNRMTLSTGKGGKYRYYKCTSRRGQGNHACSSKNIPMEKFDEMVLNQVANTIFHPDRLQILMSELRERIQSGKNSRQEVVSELERQLKIMDEKQNRLLDAIENGIVELDEITHHRSQQNKTIREALLIKMAEARRTPLPAAIEYLKPSQVDLLGKALRSKLLAKDSNLAKGYMQLLLDEVLVEDETATIKGSYASLANAMHQMKIGTNNLVPTLIPNWCARSDSNARPLVS